MSSSTATSTSIPLAPGIVEGGKLYTTDESEIQEEYKVWKKNTPFLYDLMIRHGLEWPSLTVEWLPDRVLPEGKDYSVQRLILGTHTSSAVSDDQDNKDGVSSQSSQSQSQSQSETNYLLFAEVRLPLEETVIDARNYADEDKQGGYGSGPSGKIDIIQQIVHEGEVNRARYCPQNPNIVATKSGVTPSLFIFDKSKHPSKPISTTKAIPDLVLTGHTDCGDGLSWSTRTEGHVLSGSADSLICLWDISAGSKSNTTLAAFRTYHGHTQGVCDVSFHPTNADMFGSVSDDSTFKLWDSRTDGKAQHTVTVTGDGLAVNCLSWNPFKDYLVVTGSADNIVAMWDIRNTKTRLHSFTAHHDAVYSVAWSPFAETVLASGAADRRVNIWDASLIGAQQDAGDSEDGPPELLFIHGGHCDRVNDLSWNKHEEWVLASVADDNVLHVWQMAENLRDTEDEITTTTNTTTTSSTTSTSTSTSAPDKPKEITQLE